MNRHCLILSNPKALFPPLVLVLLLACSPVMAQAPQDSAKSKALPESTKVDFTQITLCPKCGKSNPLNVYICRFCGADLLQRGRRKHPVLAVGLSVVLPGAGQFYNQEYWKGLGFMALCYSGIVLMWNDHGGYEANGPGTTNFFSLAGLGAFIYEIGWFGSAGEAWASAKAINLRKGLDSYPARKEKEEPCPKCGTMNPEEAYTCWRCGASLWGRYRTKNPVAALSLSFILPGGGQLYTGGRRKAVILLGSCATGLVMAKVNPCGSRESTFGTRLAQVSYFYSLADAPASAVMFNRKKIRKNVNMTQLGLIFVPDPREPQHIRPGLGFRAEF